MQPFWLRSLFGRVQTARRAARKQPSRLQVETLEDRVVPATLTSASGTLTYAAGYGVNNNVTVAVSGTDFVITDTAEAIDATAVAGATGSGTNTVTVPAGGVTAIALGLGDGSDAIGSGGVVVTTQAVSITNTGSLLTVGGPVRTTTGNIAITGSNQVTLANGAQVGGTASGTTFTNLTTGTVTVSANQDGAGTEGFDQGSGWVLTGNGTTAAAAITVNTAAGGTGNAVIGLASVTASGARYTATANGGSILWSSDPALGGAFSNAQRGLASGGSNAATLRARAVVLSTSGAASAIGTDLRPIQSDDTVANLTATLTAGSGGIFLTNWGANALTVARATASGAGDIRLVSANGSGHNLTVSGNVSTGSGNIYLAADDALTVNGNVVIGGAGFSGTVWMQANRDEGTAGQAFAMNATSSIVTSNTTNVATASRTPLTQAVYLDISGDQGTPSPLTVGTITAGDGARIVINAIPNGVAAEAGAIIMAGAANVLSAGTTGTVELIAGISAATVADVVGTAARPVRVAGGSVVVAANYGNVYVTGAAATSFAATTTASVSGQTGAPTTNLTTAAGTLTVTGPVVNVNGGAVNLTSTGAGGGVLINAPLGNLATGTVTVNAGTNPATLNTTLTLNPGRTVAVTAAGGLTVSPAGVLTGTGAVTNATPVTVASGGTLTPAGSGTAGTLSVGNLAAGGGGVLRYDLNGTSSFDVLNVTGTADVTGASLLLYVNSTLSVGDSFTLLANDGADAVTGQFAGGTTVAAANDPRYVFTINYGGGDGNDVVATVSAIVVTSLLDVGPDGVVTFASGNGLDNNLTVTRSGGTYTVTDTAGPIALSDRAVAAGFTGGGSQTVSGPVAAVTGLTFNLNTGADTVNGIDAGSVPVVFNGTGSLAVAGVVSTTGTVTVTGVTDITGSAAGSVRGSTLTLVAANGIGTADQRLSTAGTAIVTTAGAGGVYLAEADGADVTASATGAGSIDIVNATGTLAVAGTTTTAAGSISLASGDAVELRANVNAGSGRIVIAANTDGAGSQGYDQKAASITTTNTTAGAATITVNTPAGGTGDAVIGQGSVGNNTGGGITIASHGGSILWSSDPAYGTFDAAKTGLANAGDNTQTLKAYTYTLSTGPTGGAGTDARPLQLDNYGINSAANPVANLTAAAGTGGVYATVWDAPGNRDLTLGTVTAQGAGGIRVVTANAGGHNLFVTGNVSTGSGTIYLAADDNFVVGPNVVIGGAGFSGTVWLQGNRDQGTAGQPLTMDPTSSIVTSNTTNVATTTRTPLTQAVYLDVSGDLGTPSPLTVGTITAGDGGRVVLNAVPNGVAAEAGRIIMAGADNVLSAGPTGTVELIASISATTTADAVGTAALPVRVAGGSVVVASNFGHVFVSGDGPTAYTVTTTASVSGQTAAPAVNLATAAGPLTVAGPVVNVNGGAVRLAGAGGVVLPAQVGNAATGSVFVTGPLSGTGGIVSGSGGLTVTQDADSTYAGVIAVAQAVTKAGTGTLTLTGANTYAGGTVVSAGTLLVGNPAGSVTGTGGVDVVDGATFGGAGTAAGTVVVSGTLAPGGTDTGILNTGDLSFGAAGVRTLAADVNGSVAGTDYDQVAVTGAVNLTGAALNLAVGSGFAAPVGTKFTLIANDAADAVAGTFDGLAEGATVTIDSLTFTISYAGGDGNDVVLTLTRIATTALSNTVPGDQATPEDVPLVFSAATGNAVAVDAPGLGGGTLSVTLTATRGVLTLAAVGGLTFTSGDGAADAAMTFTGTLAAVNAALDGLRFTPDADYNGSASVTIASDDLGNTDGTAQTDTDTVAITVTPVSDNPTATGDAATVAEDSGATTIDVLANDSITPDAGETLAVAAVTQGANGGTVTLTGGVVTYAPAANFSGTDTFTYTVSDGNGGTATATVTVTVTPANDPPTANDDTATVAEDATATAIDVRANDTSAPDAGETLAVTAVTQGANGGSVTLTGGVVTYTPAADYFGTDTFTYTISDGNGGTATATVTVTVTPVNDAPAIDQLSGVVAVSAGPTPTVIDDDATVTDIDSPNFAGGNLTVTITTGGQPGDALGLSSHGAVTVTGTDVAVNGTTVGTITSPGSGGPLVVTFNGNATAAAVQEVVRAVTFQAPAGSSAGDRTVAFQVNDGAAASNVATKTVTVTANTAPTLTVAAGPVGYTENGSPVALDPGATAADPDAADFDTGTLTVGFSSGGTGDDRLTILTANGVTTSGSDILVGGTAVGTFAGGTDGSTPLVVTFNSSATLAAVQAVLRSVAYSNVSENPSTTPRQVQFVLTDGDGGTSAPATVGVAATAVNDAPVNTVPGPLTSTEDTPLTVGGISVVDADAGTVRVTLTATGGTVTLSRTTSLGVTGNGTGTVTLTGPVGDVNAALNNLTFTPAANGNGAASIRVTTDDLGNTGGPAQTDTDTVAITITPVNDAPSFTLPTPTVTVNEDSGPQTVAGFATAISAGPADEAGQTLTFLVTTDRPDLFAAQPAIDPATGELTFTSAADANGTATVTVRLRDNGGGADTSAPQTFTLTIAAVNDAPTFDLPSGTVTVAEDAGPQTVPGFATGIGTGPANESSQTLAGFDVAVTGTTGNLAFTADPAIAPDGTLTFSPAPNTNGTATVRVRLTDSGPGTAPNANTRTLTFTITVTAVNDAPTLALAGNPPAAAEDAGPQTVPGFGAFEPGPAAATDEDGQVPTYLVTVTGTTGGLSFTTAPAIAPDGTLTYTAAPNTSGTATVTVRVRDSGGTAGGGADTSASQPFTITVAPVNDPPVAADDTLTVAEDSGATVVNVLGNDSTAPDIGETLTVTAVTQPAVGGTVALAGGVVRFTPAPNFFGPTSFTYTASDGNGGTATATVAVTVTPVNDNPTANGDRITVAEDSGATVINVLANDTAAPDTGETLSVTAVSQGTRGAVSLSGGVVTYTPAPNFSGTDTFTYTVSDGNGGTAFAVVTVTVTPVNDNPTANDDTATVAEDSGSTVIDVLANDTAAPDLGEVPAVQSVTQGAHGVVSLTGGVVWYTPDANFSGSDTFTYTVTDGHGGTATATVVVTVTPVNDDPTANPDSVTVAEDSGPTVVDVLGNDTSAPEAGETLTVVAVDQGMHGTVAVTAGGGGLTYTPAPNFSGTDSFAYMVSDGNGGTSVTRVTVTVTPVNDNPTANGDAVTVAAGSGPAAVSVLANDSAAPDTGETLTITAVTQGANGGTVILAGGTVAYTPAAGFSGTDTFDYTISDGNGGTATATVTVTVAAVVDETPPSDTPPAGPPPAGAGRLPGAVTVSGGAGGAAWAFVVGPDGQLSAAATLAPFGPLPTDVRTATGDVDGDGLVDTVLVTGPGVPLRVAVVSGRDNATFLVAPFDPFAGFAGGGFVAAGDLDGDGRAEFVVTPDRSGGPRVSVYSLAAGRLVRVANYFTLDPDFRGGARAAVGDVNADGRADLVVAAGPGGGPRVAVIDGRRALSTDGFAAADRLVGDFFAFPDGLRDGAYLAVGDVDGDGYADLVFGAGSGGGPEVRVVGGRALMDNGAATATASPLARFYSGNPNGRDGVRVGVLDADGDGRADVVAGSGTGEQARARMYLGRDLGPGTPPARTLDTLGVTFLDGVYVG